MSVVFCAGCGHQGEAGGGLGFCTECGAPLIAGSYGRFEVVRVVGVGPSGVVVLAHDPTLGREVALRVLTARVVDDAEEFARLSHSVQVMAARDHDNWVRMYDLERSSQTPTVVMEYVDGASVARIMEQQALDPRACAAGLAGAIEGVQFLHELNLAHGDLTPNNVLLDRDGVSKIGDVAIPADLGPGSVVLGYAAPEQLTGSEPSAAGDIYALGSLVFGMVTGGAPFPTGSLDESLSARETGPDMSQVPAFIAPIVEQCLNTDPSSRPADAAALGEALDAAAQQEFGPGWRAAGMAGLAALVAGAATAIGITAAGGAAGAAAGAGAGAAGAGTAAGTGTGTASTGIMATLAAKPVIVAAVAAGTVAVVGGGYVAVKAIDKQTPTAAAAPAAGWTPDKTLVNGTIPSAVVPEQCYSYGEKTPLTLTNGKTKMPGTTNGSFSLIDSPLVGRFTTGGPEYTALAFQCIGDGNYGFAEIAVLDSTGKAVIAKPADTEAAVEPLKEKYAPGGSLAAGGPYKFASADGTPSLVGPWGTHSGYGYPAFTVRVALSQESPSGPIKQVATPVTPIPIAPAIAQGGSYYRQDGSSPISGLLVRRTGDQIRYQIGFSGGITCFTGQIKGKEFVGTETGYGETNEALSTSGEPVRFQASSGSLKLYSASLTGSTVPTFRLANDESNGQQFDSRCQ